MPPPRRCFINQLVPERRSAEFQRRAYREMVQEMDRGVGEILATLDELELRENTLVVFCSDNGATRVGSNGPLQGAKGTLWEGGHRVPSIVSWPGQVPRGENSDPQICLDFLPTMLAAAGVTPPEGHAIDGVNLLPVWRGEQSLADRELYWAYGNQRAARQGQWKYVEHVRGQQPPALYDLSKDVGEQQNLAAAQPERLQQLRAAWQAWHAEVTTGATPQPARN